MPLEPLQIIDIVGTFSFACSGAFAAMNRRFDPVGVVIIAFVTAIGGGTLRDVLVGNFPVSWLTNGTTITVILIAALATLFGGSYLRKLPKTLFMFDALGLGLFTIYGIEIGMQSGFHAGICIALGTISACFGGVIRDVLLNTIPLIFRKEIYAMTCVAGGLLYFLLIHTRLDIEWIRLICILLIFVIRIIVVRRRWQIPIFYLKKNE